MATPSSQTLFITGASSGIGRETVKYFSQQGWQVAATMRKPENETELDKLPGVKLFRLDVQDEASIESAVPEAIQAFGRIDVLVNNAGYGLWGPFETASPEQIKKQFDTNVFGLMNVTRAMLPHFRANRGGKIINISSMGGIITLPLYSLYHSTKFAVEGFSESLHYELEPLGIEVKLIEPGGIKTDFAGRSADFSANTAIQAYDSYVAKVRAAADDAYNKASEPRVIAETILKAATNAGKMRWAKGYMAKPLIWVKRHLPNNVYFAQVKKQLK